MVRKDIIYITIAFLACFLIGMTSGYYIGSDNSHEVITKTDTVLKEVKIKPIAIDTAKSKEKIYVYRNHTDTIFFENTVIKTDSFYCDKPYIAVFDTITANHDTLHAEYHYPQNIMTNWAVKPKPIYIPVEVKSVVYKEKDMVVERWLWGAACVGAYVLGATK